MNRKIQINNKELKYKLKRSVRARKMRITVNCDASVSVTLPSIISESFAEKFLKEKADWVLKKVEYFKNNKNLSVKKYGKRDYLKNNEKARSIILEKVEYFNKFYNFEFNRISIRNQKTRWGSCSKNRNLNFNYKLIYLPEKLANYIIVHELCHLKEFNHSENFWELVSKLNPDYKDIRKELRMTVL
jgi:predicted metal-dependent hydrolase